MIHNILRSNLFRFNSKLNYFNPNLIKRTKFNQFNNTQVRKYSGYENYYRQHYSSWSNPDFIVKAIIGTNCGVFLYHSYLKLENDPRRVQMAMYDIYKHWTFSIANLKEGRWYTVITSHFTHGSILHLAFNCMTLYSFGPTVAAILGVQRFLALYAISGLGGISAVYAVNNYLSKNPHPAVASRGILDGAIGASDCLFGVVTYYAFTFPTSQFAFFFIPVNALLGVGVGSLIGLYYLNQKIRGANSNPPRLSGRSSISHEGHLGGTLAGLLFFLFTKRPNFQYIRY